jgi:hypothetical protein
MQVVDALYALACKGHFEAIKFWLKTRRAKTWREMPAIAPKAREDDLDGRSEAELIAAVEAWLHERREAK